jgi:DNA-binding beta-propeller fold protein YncE
MGTIPLTELHGRIDHLAADIYSGRLFAAALGDDAVAVLDVRSNRLVATISSIREPQGVAYVKASNRVFVTSAADGSVHLFDGSTLKATGIVHLGRDADNLRVDLARNRVYVGYGEGALAILDTAGKHLAEIPLKAHPESFQFAEKQPRLYINVPEAHEIAVADSDTLKVLAEWPVKEGQENFAMAIDEANRRIFVACRRPSRMLVLDMDSGLVLAQLSTVGDADDLFYDPIHARLYVLGGQGQIAVYAQETADKYLRLDSVATVAGTRTGLFVAEWNRLFAAVREFSSHKAEIRVYQPQ